jgi:hypothetical protein
MKYYIVGVKHDTSTVEIVGPFDNQDAAVGFGNDWEQKNGLSWNLLTNPQRLVTVITPAEFQA